HLLRTDHAAGVALAVQRLVDDRHFANPRHDRHRYTRHVIDLLDIVADDQVALNGTPNHIAPQQRFALFLGLGFPFLDQASRRLAAENGRSDAVANQFVAILADLVIAGLAHMIIPDPP